MPELLAMAIPKTAEAASATTAGTGGDALALATLGLAFICIMWGSGVGIDIIRRITTLLNKAGIKVC